MPMFETDSHVITGLRDHLASLVGTYREGFAAREATKPGTVSIQKALSLPLTVNEVFQIEEVTDPLFAFEFPDDGARCAVVFAHLSVKLQQLSDHFKEQASLFISDLSEVPTTVLSDAELAKLKKDCSDLFQKIIELCESPEAAGQPFTVKANGKGSMLKLPGFHQKAKVDSEKLSLYVDGFIYNEERAEPYVNRAIDEAFSIKASEFLKIVPFKAMDESVEYTNPHNGKLHQVQWVKESE